MYTLGAIIMILIALSLSYLISVGFFSLILFLLNLGGLNVEFSIWVGGLILWILLFIKNM